MRTWIADGPDLLESCAGSEDGAVGDGVAEEVRLEGGGRGAGFLLRDLDLGRGSWLGGLDFSNGLDLGRSVGGRGCRGGLGSFGTGGGQVVADGVGVLSIFFLAESGYRHVAHWSLEFDQRMGAVVARGRESLAVGAEVRVMAHCAFVAVTADVSLMAFASTKWAVAMDAKVALLA